MSDTPVPNSYTGILEKGATNTTLSGYIINAFGRKILLTGMWKPGGGLELRGSEQN